LIKYSKGGILIQVILGTVMRLVLYLCGKRHVLPVAVFTDAESIKVMLEDEDGTQTNVHIGANFSETEFRERNPDISFFKPRLTPSERVLLEQMKRE